jgi:phage terminase large subunit GpA-like protein
MSGSPSADLESFDGAAEILAAWRDGMAPEPLLGVSDWADGHRILSGRGSAEPGPWRTARTPYLREIMDALSPHHPARRVVLMKGAQVGGTECGNNWIGYVIHHAPGPMLAVQPTVELAKRFSEQRIDTLIEETPALRERVALPRSRDSGNRQLSKEFPGGLLVMAGANSAVGLRSMSARFLFLDEIDAYPGDAEGEGDPVVLAEARARTFGWRSKTLLVSTPTIAGLSRIEREYLASDQRRYFVPCPFCGYQQHLRFERLRWEKGKPETALYLCESCDGGIGEAHKTAMLEAGEWRATAQPTDPQTIGFHVSSLYSPVGWLSWTEIARSWLAADGDDRALKAFVNGVLGETWQERGERPSWERLLERREQYRLGTVPSGVTIITAGADLQRDRIEVSVWGWASGYESWLIEHLVISGSPGEDATWDELAEIKRQIWPREDGGAQRITTMAVDTGGEFTSDAYRQIKRLGDPLLMACRGVEGWNANVMVSRASRTTRQVRGVELRNVASAPIKAELYRRLWLARTDEGFPPGWVHLPVGIEPEWIKQLVAEQLVTVRDRRGFAHREWQKLRERNEALDCAVLARAALHELGADRLGERFWPMAKPSVTAMNNGGTAPAPSATPGTVPPARRVGRSDYLYRIGRAGPG